MCIHLLIGVNAAKDGTLVFMVGGTITDFDAAKHVLQIMGSRVVHCGEVGMGQAAKLCNNMLLAISMIGTAEAFNLGQKWGEGVSLFIWRFWENNIHIYSMRIHCSIEPYSSSRLGLDARLLADIVNSSSGRCWSSDLYNPVPGILPNVPSSKNYEVITRVNLQI